MAFSYVFKDGIAKSLASIYEPTTMLRIQHTSTWAILALLINSEYVWGTLWPKRFYAQIPHGMISFLTVIFFNQAVRTIPLADTHTMVFVDPLIATALAQFN